MSGLEFAVPSKILGNIGAPLRTLDDENAEYTTLQEDYGAKEEIRGEEEDVIMAVDVESQNKVERRGFGDKLRVDDEQKVRTIGSFGIRALC